MTREEMLELSKEPYAQERRKFLEKNAPDFLKAMEDNGTLTEHLATVEEIVGDYIDHRCNEIQNTAYYINANPVEQIRIVQSEHVFARQDAFLEYVYALPDEETEEDLELSEGSEDYEGEDVEE